MKGLRCGALLFLLGVACLVLGPGVARCEPMTSWYLNGGLGLCHLDQEESVDEEADLGFHLGAACGYRFNRWWAVELETGVIHNSMSAGAGEEEEFGGLTQDPAGGQRRPALPQHVEAGALHQRGRWPGPGLHREGQRR
jgi:hypothetical protein